MTSTDEQVIRVPAKELNGVLQAYHTIGRFLEHYVDLEMLYNNEFINGLDVAIEEVEIGKSEEVRTFHDFAG